MRQKAFISQQLRANCRHFHRHLIRPARPVWPPVPSRLCASRRLVGADEQRGKNGISNAGAGHVEIYAKIK
jgi:hypothetical protein